VQFAILDDLLTELGVRVTFTAAAVASERVRQRDAAHAYASAFIRRRLERAAWVVDQEVEIGRETSRGWIDILAFQPTTGALLVIEVKTQILDVGAAQRQLGWYMREAPFAARRRGWSVRATRSAFVVLATGENDDVVRANRVLFAQWAPGRALALQSAADGGDVAPLPPVSFAFVDPMTRAGTWLKRSKTDGRRSLPPYVDYADFMRQLARRSRRAR